MQIIYVGLAIGSLLCAASAQMSDTVRKPPRISHVPPPPVYYKRNSAVVLPCVATGTPPFSYKWYHDRTEMTEVKMMLSREGLTLEKASISNVGSYQCHATNEWGTSVSQIFDIDIADLADFPVQNTRRIRATIGRPLVLKHYYISSRPQPTYSWKIISNKDDKNPRPVHTSKRVIQGIDGKLYFTSVTVKDKLQYRELYKVVAFNNILDVNHGGDYTRITLALGKVQKTTNPRLLYPDGAKHNVTALEGQQLKIQCIFGEDTTVPGSLVDVTWQAPDKQFDLDQSNTVLKVNSVTLKHAGLYNCTGTNSVGTSTAQILVDIETVPKFARSIQPSRQAFIEGETPSFDCQSSENTNPSATVEWLFNGVPIAGNESRTDITTLDYGKRLTIHDLKRSDTKVIQCMLSNKHKNVSSEAILIVFEHTVLEDIPISQDLDENTTDVVNFACSCKSDPSTTCLITWTHNGKPIPEQTNNFENVGNTLRVDTSNNHELVDGNYTCTASDEISEASYTATLSIKKQPLPVPQVFIVNAPKVREAVDPVQSTSYSLIALIGCSIVLLVLVGVLVVVYLNWRKGRDYMVEENELKYGTNDLENNSNGFNEDDTGEVCPQRKESEMSCNSIMDRKASN